MCLKEKFYQSVIYKEQNIAKHVFDNIYIIIVHTKVYRDKSQVKIINIYLSTRDVFNNVHVLFYIIFTFGSLVDQLPVFLTFLTVN